MNILETVRTILINAGITNVTIGDLPTDYDKCVSLFQIDGTREYFFGGSFIDWPIVRIVIRDKDASTGMQTIDKIKKILDRYKDETIKSSVIRSLDSYLGRDDKRRNVWDLSFKMSL